MGKLGNSKERDKIMSKTEITEYHDIAEITFKEARDTLRRYRERGTRQSLITLKLSRQLIEHQSGALGDEKWDVYEQAFVAAMDLGEFTIAEGYLQAVTAQFPESKRVWRLAGLLQESYGELDWAEESYRENVKTDASDAASIKRIISLYKHQGKLAECVQELNAYLAIYQCDAESWWELAEIYLGENEYEKAAFCFEELIIINPHNPLVHQRYAETKATIGGFENLKVAKKYFALAAQKSGFASNRALLGVIVTSEQLINMKGVSSQEKVELKELMNWANEKIGLKLEKARQEVTRNNPNKTATDDEITQHIEAGVDTLCSIVDSLKV